MDPVTAVGIASAAVQFLQFALQILNTCRQIRDSADRSTEQNRELEYALRKIRKSRSELDIPKGVKVPQRIADITRDCSRLSDDLIKLLEHVRGAGKSIGDLKAVLRAIRNKREIEKLVNALRQKEETLSKLFSQSLWTRTELLAIEQRADFEQLKQSVQSVAERLKELNRSCQLRSDLTHQETAKGFKQAELKASARHEEAEKNAERRLMLAESKQQHEKLLRSLFFDDIHVRRATIKDAAPETLRWIFRKDSDKGDSDKWDDFVTWLRHDSDTPYWICGKLGSGKSTLMAHIVDHPQTMRELRTWSRYEELQVLSFYFWRAGSTLQKSIIGLLRSLLYQICQAIPHITPEILRCLGTSADRLGTWTEKDLRKTILNVISNAQHVKFCLFVDGLDEYNAETNCNELISLILELAAVKHVKCCVSSRPEIHFIKRLGHCQKLRLEDLNYPDINHFVEQQLESTDLELILKADIASRITKKAEGVFLWASLVTCDILEGVISGDTRAMLYNRIQLLPQAMDSLFKAMLSKVSPVHRELLAFYTQVLNVSESISMSILTAANATTDIENMDQFIQSCHQTEIHVNARSAGLLEVTKAGYSPGMAAKFDSMHDSECTLLTLGQCKHCDRVRVLEYEFQFERRYLSFVHRSAYNFVFDEGGLGMIAKELPNETEVCFRLCGGVARYLYSITTLSPRRYLDCSEIEIENINFRFYRYINLLEHLLKKLIAQDESLQPAVGKFIDDLQIRLQANQSYMVLSNRPIRIQQNQNYQFATRAVLQTFLTILIRIKEFQWYFQSMKASTQRCPDLEFIACSHSLKCTSLNEEIEPWVQRIMDLVIRRIESSWNDSQPYQRTSTVVLKPRSFEVGRPGPTSISFDQLQCKIQPVEDTLDVNDVLLSCVVAWLLVGGYTYSMGNHQPNANRTVLQTWKTLLKGCSKSYRRRSIYFGLGLEADHLSIQLPADAFVYWLLQEPLPQDRQIARVICFPQGFRPDTSYDFHGHGLFERHCFLQVTSPKAFIVPLRQLTSRKIFSLVCQHFPHSTSNIIVGRRLFPKDEFCAEDKNIDLCRALLLEDICTIGQDLGEIDQVSILACIALHFKKAFGRGAEVPAEINNERWY